MKCIKCGFEGNSTDKFCQNCGEANPQVIDSEPTGIGKQNNNSKKMPLAIKISLIVGGAIIIVVVIFFVLIFNVVSSVMKDIDLSSNSLVCKADGGSVTLYYTDELCAFAVVNYDFDFDEQKEIAKSMGIDNYIEEFSRTFERRTGGSCIVRKKDSSNDNTQDDEFDL